MFPKINKASAKQTAKLFQPFILFTFFAMLFIASFAWAADQQQIYQVNIVVFKNPELQNLNSDLLLNPDLWQKYQLKSLNDAIQLQQPTQFASDNNGNNDANNVGSINDTHSEQQSYYQVLPQQQFLLTKEVKRLKRHKQYQILTQLSWLQPITTNNRARPVQIYGGQQYDPYGQLWELNGTIQLKQSAYQYMTLKTSLELNELNDNNLQSLPLQQTRRILPNQLNYIDSPGFGMLVMIKPIEAKK